MTSLIVSAFAIATAIGVHEFGHAFVAYKMGDPTAKNLGRMTPNPLAHLDPIGLLMMVLVGIGFARPVEVNSRNFKNERQGTILVALAGALFNVLTAILCVLLMKVINVPAAQLVLTTIVVYNISFASFNLLPLPMLDGWRIVKEFIPYKYYEEVYKYENMSMFIFLLMVLTKAHVVIMGPIQSILNKIVFMFM